MFVDKVSVRIEAGDGGRGAVSFRHEKFVDKGGPDGGDGGDGGSIVLRASRNQNTLASFRFQKLIKAEEGQYGSKRKKHGKRGKDHLVDVPIGTVVYDNEGGKLADLSQDGQTAVIAEGGKGGFGNAHFVSSVRQAPRVAEKGEKGEKFDGVFELKMIADVGLVGLPNAGKSTLLSVISNARPEIADYAFTTTIPNLGVVDVDKNNTLLIADIPGLIEGASEGKGLGDEFLRHVERTKVLIHLIDAYSDNVAKDYQTIIDELASYKANLTEKPQIIALTKIEGLDQEIITSQMSELQPLVAAETPMMAISSKSKQGLKELIYEVKQMVDKVAAEQEELIDETPVYKIPEEQMPWKLIKRDNGFLIKGRKIEKFAARTDFDNEDGIRRLRDIMKKMGIMRELEKSGVKKGQTIEFGNNTGKIEF